MASEETIETSVIVEVDEVGSNQNYLVIQQCSINMLGTLPQKKRENVGILKNQGWEGLPKSHFFCNLTKWFLSCQIHSEVLKHVL